MPQYYLRTADLKPCNLHSTLTKWFRLCTFLPVENSVNAYKMDTNGASSWSYGDQKIEVVF